MSGFKIAVRGATGQSAGQAITLDMTGLCGFLVRFFHGRSVAKQTAGLTGIPASTVEKWLRGETRASGDHLAALACVFGPPLIAAAMPQAHWAREAALDADILDLTGKLERAIRQRLAA